jgi:hypothetical protein
MVRGPDRDDDDDVMDADESSSDDGSMPRLEEAVHDNSSKRVRYEENSSSGGGGPTMTVPSSTNISSSRTPFVFGSTTTATSTPASSSSLSHSTNLFAATPTTTPRFDFCFSPPPAAASSNASNGATNTTNSNNQFDFGFPPAAVPTTAATTSGSENNNEFLDFNTSGPGVFRVGTTTTAEEFAAASVASFALTANQRRPPPSIRAVGPPLPRSTDAAHSIVPSISPDSSSNSGSNTEQNNSGNNTRGNYYSAIADDEDEEDDENGDDYYEDEDDDDDDDDDYDEDYIVDEEQMHEEDSDDDRPSLPEFLGIISRMMDNNEEDDDDSTGSPCTCPHCVIRALLGRDADSDSDDDDNDDHRNHNTDNNTVVDDDPNAPTCAICLEQETIKRPFFVLPCCGGHDGKAESSSSTRFCRRCVTKCIARNGIPSSQKFMVGECPRCKHLLVLQEEKQQQQEQPPPQKNNPKRSNTKDDPKRNKRRTTTQLTKANIHHMHWYIGKKDGGSYRLYLVALAFSCAHHMPIELLDLSETGSEERIAHLCHWGLLQRIKHKSTTSDSGEDSYRITEETQVALRHAVSNYLEVDSDGDLTMRTSNVEDVHVNMNRLCFIAALNCISSAWSMVATAKWWNKLWGALRLLNRGVTLLLLTTGYLLPHMTEWHRPKLHGTMATCLNLFLFYLLLKILARAFWIVCHLVVAGLAANLVGSCIQTPTRTWQLRIRNGTWCVLAIKFLYEVYHGLVGDRHIICLEDTAVDAMEFDSYAREFVAGNEL